MSDTKPEKSLWERWLENFKINVSVSGWDVTATSTDGKLDVDVKDTPITRKKEA